jgi:hypothetical protein
MASSNICKSLEHPSEVILWPISGPSRHFLVLEILRKEYCSNMSDRGTFQHCVDIDTMGTMPRDPLCRVEYWGLLVGFGSG